MAPPSKYTKALADRVIDRLEQGGTLKQCCRDPGMPVAQTVLNWVTKDVDGFADRYLKAREIGYMLMADEIMEISDTQELGEETTTSEDGVTVKTADMIQHRKLRVDTRKWLLGKVLPKIYGPKLPPLPETKDGNTIIITGGLPE
jgi:hypothetical protein